MSDDLSLSPRKNSDKKFERLSGLFGGRWTIFKEIVGERVRLLNFVGNFLHVTDGVLKIVWVEKVQLLLFHVAFRWYIMYSDVFCYVINVFYIHRTFWNIMINNIAFDIFFNIVAFQLKLFSLDVSLLYFSILLNLSYKVFDIWPVYVVLIFFLFSLTVLSKFGHYYL